MWPSCSDGVIWSQNSHLIEPSSIPSHTRLVLKAAQWHKMVSDMKKWCVRPSLHQVRKYGVMTTGRDFMGFVKCVCWKIWTWSFCPSTNMDRLGTVLPPATRRQTSILALFAEILCWSFLFTLWTLLSFALLHLNGSICQPVFSFLQLTEIFCSNKAEMETSSSVSPSVNNQSADQ